MDEEEFLAQLETLQAATEDSPDAFFSQLQSLQDSDAPPAPVTTGSVGGDLLQGFNAIGQNTLGQALGMDRVPVPETMAGRIGNVAPTYAAMALTGGGLATQIPQVATVGTTAIKGLQPLVQNTVSQIGSSLARNPVLFSAYESLAATSAAAGGWIAEQSAPDSPAARFVGEVLGGIAPAGAVAALQAVPRAVTSVPLVSAAGRFVNTLRGKPVVSPNTPAVQQRIDRATDARGQALARMDEELVPGLTPAAQSGDEGLLRLEAAVNQQLEDSHKFIKESFKEVQRNMRAMVDRMSSGTGTVEDVQAVILSQRQRLEDILDENLRVAALTTERRLSQLSPSMGREAANDIVAEELRTAYRTARTQESTLYKLIPEDVAVSTVNSQNAWATLRQDTPRALRGHLPSYAKTFLSPKGKSFLGDQTTIHELRGLQSRLRTDARVARAAGESDRARLADQLADSITDDIATASGASEQVKTAVEFSRKLHDRFTKGTVGRLLGRDRAGTTTPEGLFLENTIGTTPARAREAFNDILNAADDSNVVNEAVTSFISSNFLRRVTSASGELNRNAAVNFLRDNDEILKKLPALKKEMELLVESADIQAFRTSQQSRINFTDPRKSLATMYIRENPHNAFTKALNSPNPVREMRNLVNMTKVADEEMSSRALSGLRGSLTDFIFDRVSGTATGDISGKALASLLNQKGARPAFRAVFSPDEMQRWETIARTATRLEAQRAATPSSEGVIPKGGSALANILAGMSGARFGTFLSGMMGGKGNIQTPGIMANQFRKMVDLGINPHRKLLEDAVQNERLFRTLLEAKVLSDGMIAPEHMQYINAWAIGTIQRAEEALGANPDVPSEATIPQ